MPRNVMRKVLGVIMGTLLSCISTYAVLSAFHSFPGIRGVFMILGISAVAGVVGGFVSGDSRAGYLSGLLGGLAGVPLTTICFGSLMLKVSFLSLLIPTYSQGLGTYVLSGLIGGTLGVAGALAEGKLMPARED